MKARDLLYKQKLTDLLHILFCEMEHSDEPTHLTHPPEDSSICLYNVENTLLNPWSRRDHQRWAALTEDFLESTTLISYEDAFLLWVELLDRHRQVEELIAQQPALRGWFLKLL